MIDFNELTLADAAREYAKMGIPVFPLAPRDKTPLISAKNGGHGNKDATTDPVQVAAWWQKCPNANIGTPTGRGLVMIDADRDENKLGPEQFEGWEANNGAFGDSWRVTTGRGGFHMYLKTELELHNVQQDQPSHLRDIDFRGVGGYAVLPPSVHENGKKYQWDDEHGPGEIEVAQNDELLARFHAELTPKKHKTQTTQETQSTLIAHRAALENTLENLDIIEQGKRNGTLFSEACALIKRGWDPAAVQGAISAINEKMCQPPLDSAEVARIVASAAGYERGAITKHDSSALKVHEVAEYLTGDAFGRDIDYFKKYAGRGTGFLSIDSNLILYPGLAALGGSSSLGKTTFAIQLADNLVAQGETVIYFSLEQEPIELVTKSLARRLNEAEIEAERDTHLTNTKIKNGDSCPELEHVKQKYAEMVAGRLFIVRGDFRTTAADIRDYIEGFIKDHDVKPIVIIDYLQLISPPEGFRGDTRAATDLAIKTFKAVQTKNELLVILVSSFNRSGYDQPVSYESFKESGMIEFTCDYVWGLQLELLSHHDFYFTEGSRGERMTTPQERDKMITAAIAEYPKRVQFVSLKSRNGKQRYKCDFWYYMPYDYFADPAIEIPFA